MCIICNMPDFKADVAVDFLDKFAAASRALKAASDALLACSKIANTPEASERYDATHKQMVRLTREWNRLEEARENGHVPRANGQRGDSNG